MFLRTVLFFSTTFCVLTCGINDITYAQDRNSSERFFGYLDRDKNGRLDEKEVRRMPSSVREAFQDADFSLDRGISKEDFVREMPRIMEQMRKKREEERERRNRDREDDQADGRRQEDSRRDDDRRGDSRRGTSRYSPRERPNITMEIPSKFEDGDTDEDGQIGLYEWRKWKPEERHHFPAYDINQDGFLTPRELSNPPSQEEIDRYLATVGFPSPPPQAKIPGDSKTTSANENNGPQPTAQRTEELARVEKVEKIELPENREQAEPVDAETKTARLYFKQMDADSSGQLTPDEWARSRRLKPKFEQAGIDLSKPMSLETFTTAYKKAMEAS